MAFVFNAAGDPPAINAVTESRCADWTGKFMSGDAREVRACLGFRERARTEILPTKYSGNLRAPIGI